MRLFVNQPATVAVVFEKVGFYFDDGGGGGERGATEYAGCVARQCDCPTDDRGTAFVRAQRRQPASIPAGRHELRHQQQHQVSNNNPTTGIDDRNGSVNGGRSDQGNVTLDGVDVNNQSTRAAFTSVLRVTPDSVEEFRSTTSNGDASKGRASGADIALVTKSGTNDLHGAMYEYRRGTETAANDFFSNRSGVPVAPLNINIFGAAIHGPIKKNKAFFFANYEGTARCEFVDRDPHRAHRDPETGNRAVS